MTLKKSTLLIAGTLLISSFLMAVAYRATAAEGEKKASDADLAKAEKEKALANPYPNDLGPDNIKDEIKDYPADKQEGYKALLLRCVQCHTTSRPLNSRFVELPGKDQASREAAIAKLKKEQPELFKDASVWQIEWNAWNRYVHRMMDKPGCGKKHGGQMTDAEAKKIWDFLVYDSVHRKIGENAKKWEAHRKKLIAEFKEKHPERFKDLARDKDL